MEVYKRRIMGRYVIAAMVMLVLGFCQPGTKKAAIAAESVSFSVENGVYENAFSLELSAGGDTIYYTIDGSDPTDVNNTGRIQYSEPIMVTDRKNDANVLSAIDPGLFDSANVEWDSKNKKFVSKIQPPADNQVDKATVIRAASVDASGNYSEIQTNTYFVGQMGEHIQGIKESCQASGMDLSIMSISVKQEDFFDYEKGIYVHGKIFDEALEEYLKSHSISNRNAVDVARSLDANYKQKGKDWERQAHIEYFESNGDTTECKLQQDCGIRIQGNYSRSDLQKGMRLYAREEYGPKKFKYAFFGDTAKNDEGNTIKSFKKLTLRNGGNCAFNTKYSDAYWQSLIRDLSCETQASRVCVVYLNGEYWGLYILQEEYDNNYFEETHGVNKDNVVIYKGDAEAYEIGYKLDEGELPEGETDESYYFRDLLEFYKNHSDLKKQEDYEAFTKLVDEESVRDFFAVNVWINNKWDWPGKNWSAWRVTETEDSNPYGDGRWRLCFYDLDFGGVSGAGDAWTNTIQEDNYKDYGLLDMDTDNPVVLMFAYLMTNDNFREDFATTLNHLTQNNFEANAAVAACEVYRDTYQPLYDQFFARYGNVGSTQNAIYGGYSSFSCITGFIQNRSKAIPGILQWVDDFYKTHTIYNSKTAKETEEQPVEPTPSENPGKPFPSPDKSSGTSTEKTQTKPNQKKTTVKKKKIKPLKISAKKGKKVITVKTVKKSKVTIKLSKKVLRSGKKKVKKITISPTKNKKGKLSFQLSGKLKKGMKITVTVSKKGYSKKTVVKKIK